MSFLSMIKRHPLVLPLACAAALTMLVISESAYWRSAGTLDKLAAMAAIPVSIETLPWSIVDAQAAQIDYSAGGRPQDLQRYREALVRIDDAFGALDAYYAGASKPSAPLGALHGLAAAKLSSLARAVQRGPPAHDAAVGSGGAAHQGDERLDAIRSLSSELLRSEVSNVSESRSDLARTLTLSRVAVAALSVLSLLALAMYLRQTFALGRQQQALQRVSDAAHCRLEAEVVHRTAQLTELARHLETAREDERARLARDLHDEMGAFLTAAKLDAALIRSRLVGVAPEALERLGHLVETLNSGIAMKRRIIEDLRPSSLGMLGLVTSLEILAGEFAARSGLEVHRALEPVSLSASAELMVYRLVQEAITNITKYAKAAHIWIALDSLAGKVEVSVRDDGIGFDVAAPLRSSYGLVGMRFRAEAEGGVLSVVSTPGLGTLIRATLPEAP